jgi:hypothetical protein
MKMLGNTFAVLAAAAACTSPYLLRGFPNAASDLHQALMARALSGILFWQHGFYTRVPQLLSGIEPWSSGLYSVKLDSLFMGFVTSSSAITAILFIRCALFIALLSVVFYLRYGVQFYISVALASCALVGLNVLQWLYFWPDYLAGGTFGLWGYVLFPVLLIPLALEKRVERMAVLMPISFATGLLYGMTTTYPYAIFGSVVAAVWIAAETGSFKGWTIAAVNALGVACAAAVELAHVANLGTNGTRGKFLLLFDWKQTPIILLHRGGLTALAALALAVVSIALAASHPKDRVLLVKLALIYIGVMILDPVMKTRGLEFVFPPFVLSVSYYTYAFAPIVLAAFLAIGFRYLRGPSQLLMITVMMVIVIILTWDKSGIEVLFANETSSFSVIREVVGALKNGAAPGGRAVIIRETERDLYASKSRLQRLSPNDFATFELNMADGYISNPDNMYSAFMSNVMAPQWGPTERPTIEHQLEHQVVLTVPVMTYFAEAARGCLEQKTALPIDTYLELSILENAAVQYVISMYMLQSDHLRMKTAGAPVFCPQGRGQGRPFVYELVQPALRVGLAREISVVDNLDESYRVMREDPEFARNERVVLTKEEMAKLGVEVGGIARGLGRASLVADDGDQLTLAVSTPQDGLLFVRDSYSQPVVAADGEGALEVVRINGAFIGIHVRSGDSNVTMRFR